MVRSTRARRLEVFRHMNGTPCRRRAIILTFRCRRRNIAPYTIKSLHDVCTIDSEKEVVFCMPISLSRCCSLDYEFLSWTMLSSAIHDLFVYSRTKFSALHRSITHTATIF